MRSRMIVIVLSCMWGVLVGAGLARAQTETPTCDDNGTVAFRVIDIAPDIPDDWCLECQGPWLRESNATPVKFMRSAISKQGFCRFYAALEVSGFSLYGDWSCGLFSCETSGSENWSVKRDFCVSSTATSSGINLILYKDLIDPVHNSSCSTRSLSSTLGAERNRDRFTFIGEAGAALVVTVKPDNKSGHNDGQATLRASGAGGKLETTGRLPLKLTGTLPASGEYSITVEQATVEASERFRGTYHVIVESQSDGHLEPLREGR